LATASQLGRRSSVAVLAVTATAVAMLGLLVAQTTRQIGDAELLSEASRQRMLSERVTTAATAARLATGDEQEAWRRRLTVAATEWRESSDRLVGVTSEGPRLPRALRASDDARRVLSLQRAVLTAADRVAGSGATRAAGDSLATR
jgi:hypothetical protein